VRDGLWKVAIDWGDGTETRFADGRMGSLLSRAHTYAVNGTYTIKIRVMDKDGGVGTGAVTIRVIP
jgi:hypothetical protein